MKPLETYQRELDYRECDGIEVQLVYDSLLKFAYSRVEDHKNNDEFLAIAPEPIPAVETFRHPFIYRVTNPAYLPKELLDGRGVE